MFFPTFTLSTFHPAERFRLKRVSIAIPIPLLLN